MLKWLTQRRKMVGGLFFGPAGWSPERIEGLAQGNGKPAPALVNTAANQPNNRTLVELLKLAGVEQTSAIVPSIMKQAADISDPRIRSLVLNLLPTQPEFALPLALSRTALADVLDGLAAIQHHVRARRVSVALDRHDHALRRIWKKARGPLEFNVVSLLNRYPQAHHTVLLRSLYGKEVPPGDLPTRAHRMVVDVVSSWALGRYMRTGEKMTRRPVQLFVREESHKREPRIVMAEIGETVAALLERHTIAWASRQVIVNGMLAGRHVDAATTPIAADTESIAVRQQPAEETASPCIACGWCLDHCPTGLNPVGLYELSRKASGRDTDQRVPLGLQTSSRESLFCVGCGLCSYVCPTRLPLMPQILQLQTLVARTQEPAPPSDPAEPDDEEGAS